MSNDINSKELLTRLKDYADCSDAAYAFLHWVYTNEEDDWFDKFKDDPEPRWKFADGVSKGHELNSDVDFTDQFNETRTRKAGTPTAYALAIEARFNQDMVIKNQKDK